MRKAIANFVKAHPRLYDKVNRLRPLSSEYDRFVRSFSKPGLRFMQIGANDGLRWDPLRRFIVDDHWRGLLIEPLPEVFKLLERNYDHIQDVSCVNTAIGVERGVMEFWTFTPEFLDSLSLDDKLTYLRRASLHAEHLLKFLPPQSGREAIERITVPSATVEAVLHEHGLLDVDFIAVDAEGYDGEIVRSIDLSVVQPKFLVYESHNLTEEDGGNVAAYLRQSGYEIVPLGGDTGAIRKIC